MSKMKRDGVAYFSKKKDLLYVHFFSDAEGERSLDDSLKFLVFVADLDSLRAGNWDTPSVGVFKVEKQKS